MRSHSYHFKIRDLFKIVAAPIAALCCLSLIAHGFNLLHALPETSPSSYIDDIVITEKNRAASNPHDVDLLFVGDSSCLMGFSTRRLEQLLPPTRAYNLATLSTLGLESFGLLASNYLQRAHAKTIVLLISQEMIRSGNSTPTVQYKISPEMLALSEESARAKARLEKSNFALLAQYLALPLIKTQFVTRIFEIPYELAFGRTYGFPSGLREYIRSDNGSAVDPGAEDVPRQPRPRQNFVPGPLITERFKVHCQSFRRSIPREIPLLVGITPAPASELPPNAALIQLQTLSVLQEFLHADGILTNLPISLPDHYFSSSTHLSPEGSRQFTHSLAAALRDYAANHFSPATNR